LLTATAEASNLDASVAGSDFFCPPEAPAPRHQCRRHVRGISRCCRESASTISCHSLEAHSDGQQFDSRVLWLGCPLTGRYLFLRLLEKDSDCSLQDIERVVDIVVIMPRHFLRRAYLELVACRRTRWRLMINMRPRSGGEAIFKPSPWAVATTGASTCLAARPLLHGVDPVWVEGEIVPDSCYRRVRRFIGPDSVGGAHTAERNAVVSAVAL
jgi:hypothetical protein